MGSMAASKTSRRQRQRHRHQATKTLFCGPYSVLPHVDVLYGGSVAQPDNGVRRGQDALPSVACNLQGVVARLDLSPGVLYHPGRRLAGKGPKVEQGIANFYQRPRLCKGCPGPAIGLGTVLASQERGDSLLQKKHRVLRMYTREKEKKRRSGKICLPERWWCWHKLCSVTEHQAPSHIALVSVFSSLLSLSLCVARARIPSTPSRKKSHSQVPWSSSPAWPLSLSLGLFIIIKPAPAGVSQRLEVPQSRPTGRGG